jgi:hypothetical protein
MSGIVDTSQLETPAMSDAAIIDLFDRWEKVWHDGRYDLIPSCVGPNYIRHDQMGDRTVTRDVYTAELEKIRQARPDIRVVVPAWGGSYISN